MDNRDDYNDYPGHTEDISKVYNYHRESPTKFSFGDVAFYSVRVDIGTVSNDMMARRASMEELGDVPRIEIESVSKMTLWVRNHPVGSAFLIS